MAADFISPAMNTHLLTLWAGFSWLTDLKFPLLLILYSASSTLSHRWKQDCGVQGIRAKGNGAKSGWTSAKRPLNSDLLKKIKLRKMAQENWKKETDETECQTPEGPVLCANHCGFLGSAATKNLCSKCYNMFMKQQQQHLLVTAPVTPLMGNAMPSSSVTCQSIGEEMDVVEEMQVINTEGSSSESMSDKQQSKRCLACQRRVGLTGFKCKCGGTFCSTHRYSETHECSFDYRTAGREAIAKANPVVKAAKLEKI